MRHKINTNKEGHQLLYKKSLEKYANVKVYAFNNIDMALYLQIFYQKGIKLIMYIKMFIKLLTSILITTYFLNIYGKL